MASIFDGVPFIVDIPGRRPPENHAAQLAVGVQLADVINRKRVADRRASQDDRELDMRESYQTALNNQRDAQAQLLQSRIRSMADETADQALMNEWLPQLYQNPDAVETPQFKTLNALEQWEKSRMLIEQRKLGINRLNISQGVEKRIQGLPDGSESARLLSIMFKEGMSDNLISQLRQAESQSGIVQGLTPSANTAIFAEKMRMQGEQLKSVDPAAASRLTRTADKIEASSSGTDVGQKARLEVAKAEFEAAIKDKEPDSPEWVAARNKYLREVESATGGQAQSNAADLLQSFGVGQEELRETLKRAAEAFKQNQGGK